MLMCFFHWMPVLGKSKMEKEAILKFPKEHISRDYAVPNSGKGLKRECSGKSPRLCWILKTCHTTVLVSILYNPTKATTMMSKSSWRWVILYTQLALLICHNRPPKATIPHVPSQTSASTKSICWVVIWGCNEGQKSMPSLPHNRHGHRHTLRCMCGCVVYN